MGWRLDGIVLDDGVRLNGIGVSGADIGKGDCLHICCAYGGLGIICTEKKIRISPSHPDPSTASSPAQSDHHLH